MYGLSCFTSAPGSSLNYLSDPTPRSPSSSDWPTPICSVANTDPETLEKIRDRFHWPRMVSRNVRSIIAPSCTLWHLQADRDGPLNVSNAFFGGGATLQDDLKEHCTWAVATLQQGILTDQSGFANSILAIRSSSSSLAPPAIDWPTDRDPTPSWSEWGQWIIACSNPVSKRKHNFHINVYKCWIAPGHAVLASVSPSVSGPAEPVKKGPELTQAQWQDLHEWE